MEIALSTFLGFIAGILSSWFFWKYLLLQKPNVNIASNISVEIDQQNGKRIYRFKIYNYGNNQAINITFKAWLCDLLDVPGGKVSRSLHQFPIDNSETLTLNPENRSDRPWGLNPYTTFLSIPEFGVEELLSRPNHRILATLKVSDALSGTTVVQQKTFSKENLIYGSFGVGESMKIFPSGNINK